MTTTIQATLFSICIASTSAMAEDFNHYLEPCINGEVSESGLFPNQEAEDRYNLEKVEKQGKYGATD